ncbi:U4/U6.U5 tri-snRNP component SNU23 [Galdieria sulphuraria]|uniref:U4/U6.U5 tri-snRNP component SNU23 n=1 Tax=Galdieria sulphuraria TaxID=130081 RepID=M2XTG5_GALSU|nr:U4/U6.U5 tri-snRNP component SNU23 [Galdieria sulphuraria]EME26938.1 U4/U6.U5 tri-snRNP component SNU23 [Galdieria sulphuraria]|eukprot:XP_005703458.1 U4/U6.U5 tri-snRNP component SNU23 [Galdieria sulphuraria]
MDVYKKFEMNKGKARVSNVTGRRTWDKAFFEVKAKEQKEQDEKNERERAKKAKQPEQDDPFAPTRSWLERRDYQLDFEKRVGKATVVSSLRDKNSGFYCEICKVLQKDSNAYLNHLNSRIHQKNLGMSLRVERVDVDSVKSRIEKLSRYKDGDVAIIRSQEESDSTDMKHSEEEQYAAHSKDSEDYETIAKTMGLPLSFASKHE